mmetsp:Transcript_2274/g.4988  ORF Transcript_2274/g.4988 Transcript_2274/m.4988 type:complete len:211 (+) Transcript_2274:2266-2898(+)
MVVPSPAFREGDGHLALPGGGRMGPPSPPASPPPPPPGGDACRGPPSSAPSSWSTRSFISTWSAMTSSYSRIIASHSCASCLFRSAFLRSIFISHSFSSPLDRGYGSMSSPRYRFAIFTPRTVPSPAFFFPLFSWFCRSSSLWSCLLSAFSESTKRDGVSRMRLDACGPGASSPPSRRSAADRAMSLAILPCRDGSGMSGPRTCLKRQCA